MSEKKLDLLDLSEFEIFRCVEIDLVAISNRLLDLKYWKKFMSFLYYTIAIIVLIILKNTNHRFILPSFEKVGKSFQENSSKQVSKLVTT